MKFAWALVVSGVAAGCATAIQSAPNDGSIVSVGRITSATWVEGALPVREPDVFFSGRLYTFEPVLRPETKLYFVDWNTTCPGNPPSDQVYRVYLGKVRYVLGYSADTQPIKGNWSDVLELKACVAINEKDSSAPPQ
jgi:hypothetical protein